MALSADGNTALVGGPNDRGLGGAAWVFTRSGGVWIQQGNKLVGTDASPSTKQGISVALSADGNTALVGGPGDNNLQGAAWVFTRSGSVWSQQGPKLVGSGSVGSPQQGSSVALSADGNTALVGGSADNSGAGATWVFTRVGSFWTQQGPKLVGFDGSGAQQGCSVALTADGNTALVGGSADNSGAGAAWVFTRLGSAWSQHGPKLVGSGASGPAFQGSSVALSGDGKTALVGGPHDNVLLGAAWVFTKTGNVWSQQGPKLLGSGAGPGALQGQSVALSGDGNTAFIGGPGGAVPGAAWEFTRSAGLWSQQGSTLVGTGASGAAQQGVSVALSSDGGTALVGGPMDNGGVGATWVFAAPKPSAITLSASVNPSLAGQAVTYTAAVTPGATGSVVFTIDGTPQPPIALTGNQAQFTISSLSPRLHSISAEYGGDAAFLASTSHILRQFVQLLGRISLWENTVVDLGESARIVVRLSTPAPENGLTVFLTSSDTSKVTVAPSVFIPFGWTVPRQQPLVTGLDLGTSTITAMALGFTPDSQTVRVTASIRFERCCVTIVGPPVNAVLDLSGPAPSEGLTINLTSADPAVATVPATITFPPNATSVDVPITGVSVGNTVIHANGVTPLLHASIRVTVNAVTPPGGPPPPQ